jgi:perosamine synthetase
MDIKAILAALRRVLPEGQHYALHEPEFTGHEKDYVVDCIDTGWVSSVGAYVDRFEQMLTEYTGAKHAVAVANGTAALHMCLVLAGVERDDEVLIPALTFIATANAVSYCGAIPHFCESEWNSLGLDAKALDAYLNETAELRDDSCFNRATGRRIRAVMPMHVFGHPVDLDALVALAARWKLVLVEDAAESLGSFRGGLHTGNTGIVAGLSFNGNKTVTTGGGGAILTNDAELGRRAKHLTTTARVKHQWAFIHDEVGFNYRLPNLNAALGCAQMEQLPRFIAQKRVLAQRYIDAFQDVPGIRVLKEPAGSAGNYWLNALILDAEQAHLRDALLEATNAAGIMTRPVWTLMHRLPMYAQCPRMPLPVAEEIEARLVNIPSTARLGA